MTVTYPSTYVVTKTAALVLPPIAASPVTTAMLNANAAYELHNPSPATVVWTTNPDLVDTIKFRQPITVSADGIDYDFIHVVRSGTGTTGITVTVETQSGGAGYTTIYGPTLTAAAASSVITITHTDTIAAATDEIRITYSRGADPYTPDSLTVLPGATGPTSKQTSGFWPYSDGVLTATGAPINTELINRPIRNTRAIYNDRDQCVLSFGQADDSTLSNVRYDLTDSLTTPAGEPQKFGVVTASVPYWPKTRTINISVLATVDGGTATDAIRVRTPYGATASFTAGTTTISTPHRQTLVVNVQKAGTAQAFITFILEGLAKSGRKTYLHAVTGSYEPTESTALYIQTVTASASIALLTGLVRSVENLMLRPWPQPALMFEGNTTGLTARRWTCVVPPAVQRMNMMVARSTTVTNNGATQTDSTIATTTTSGVPASPAAKLVTVACPSYGAEGYLDIDGSGGVPADPIWSSDSYDQTSPGSTIDRMLVVTEALAPANEVVEVTTTVGASLHYVRLRSPADYQEI